MKMEVLDGELNFTLTGRIDSSNVKELEVELKKNLAFIDTGDIAFDAQELDYISSAGLRLLLTIKKTRKCRIRIYNVSDEIFDILSVTGFTDILEVEREMRRISLKNCSPFAAGLNGEIFSLPEDEMIKVYGEGVSINEIKKERKYAQAALVCGIPTLIPYDVVRSEKGYGLIFERVGASTIAMALKQKPERLEELATRFAGLLLELHSTDIPEGKLPDIKDRYRGWIHELGGSGDAQSKVFFNLISSIADKSTYVHGDISLNSVLVKDDELILFDMAGSARGHALFDLQGIFASLVAIEKTREGYCEETFGLPAPICMKFWMVFFKEYMKNTGGDVDSMNNLLLKYFVLKERVLSQVERKHRLG